ncbi:MAG: hypothetical protein QXO98_00900 [Sulfolobales archaeon]
MHQEITILIITSLAVIVSEYFNYLKIIKTTTKCNLNYLSNIVKCDLDDITTYVAGKRVELRTSFNTICSSIYLPFRTPTIIINLDLLLNNKDLSIKCLIHEACHIANKSSLKFLAAKTLSIPIATTLVIYSIKQLTTISSLVIALITLLILYKSLNTLSIYDERKTEYCTNRFIGST